MVVLLWWSLGVHSLRYDSLYHGVYCWYYVNKYRATEKTGVNSHRGWERGEGDAKVPRYHITPPTPRNYDCHGKLQNWSYHFMVHRNGGNKRSAIREIRVIRVNVWQLDGNQILHLPKKKWDLGKQSKANFTSTLKVNLPKTREARKEVEG